MPYHIPTGIPRKSLSGKYHPMTMVTSFVSPGPSLTLPDIAPDTYGPLGELANPPLFEKSSHELVTSSSKPKDVMTYIALD